MIILGIQGGITVNQHESSAAIVKDGELLACCEEERYTRIKASYGLLPNYSIKAVLKEAKIRFEDIGLIVSCGETYADYEAHLRDYFRYLYGSCPRIKLVHHQTAHVAKAFYSSGYDESLCLALDASGDGKSGLLAYADKANGIKNLEWVENKNSIGFFYTLMTFYLGFTDGDEYKVMGLAPYGERGKVDLSRIVKVTGNGWEFDDRYLKSQPKTQSPFEPPYSPELIRYLGKEGRRPDGELSQYYRDVARATQDVLEDSIVSLAGRLQAYYPAVKNLCYAGGVALNCSANRKLLHSGRFDNIFVPPMASDRGLSVGCAFLGALDSGDRVQPLKSAYLGSAYSDDSIRDELTANGIKFREIEDPAETALDLIAENKIIGWFQGRSEAGARALGNRSILANPQCPDMKEKVNKKIKYREEFRPFAPAATEESAGRYFESMGRPIPYMNFTVQVKKEFIPRLPATTHVDGSARLQTVNRSENRLFHDLIEKLGEKIGMPVVLNTSFNLKGQPIVESPRDALMTFYGCGLDALVLGGFLIEKRS